MSQHPLVTKPLSSIGLFQKLRQSFQLDFKSFLDQVVYLRRFGFRVSNDYDVATSIFLSGIVKIPDVKDCSCIKKEGLLSLRAYIETTNFEVEAKIYDIYAQLLEYFPDTNIDVKVVELYGRSKDELEPLIK
jgi:hypothetical protein